MNTTEYFKRTIQAYLEERAMEDELFAAKYDNPDKNIDDCVTYILNWVQKSGCNGFCDDEIYGQAIHYYEEKDIEVGKPLNCQVSVNHHIELTEEEKAQARQEAIRQYQQEQMNKMRNRDTAKRTSQRTDNRSTPTIIIRHVMKPRTKYQKQVVTSNKGLRPIKGAQMQWAFRECLDHYAFQLKHGQTTCMDCGHTWTTDEDADKCVCPKCKAKLEVQRTKRQKAMSSTYFSVLTERKGLQLMRAFQMKAYYRKGQKADIYCWEVARYWMNEKGKVEVMARKRTMGIYMDTFCYDSDIELRKDNTTYQHIASFPVCPDMKVIPQIWRNGFDGAFHGIEPLTLFKAMLTDHRIETMMKQCRYGHVRHFIDHPRHLETCWNAYKIANRNHYLITDIGKWADYICMLVEMGKDIRSPHYICPDNLEAEHDRISEKIRAKKEKERTEEEIRKALKNEDKFKEMKSRFFGLMFTDGNIVVRMLESVREHVLEGKAMHHCVGSGTNYSLNPDCIIFSARIAEQRVETVEFSLEQMKVVQCHGLQNKDTEHHADIINLVNSNARLIEQRMVATT